MARAVNAEGAAVTVRPGGWPTGRRATIFSLLVLLAAVGLAGSALLAHLLDVAFAPIDAGIAALAYAGSLLPRLRVRVGVDDIGVGWVEVGLTAVLCLAAPVWAPVAVAVGAGLALAPRLPRARTAGRAWLLYAWAALVIAAIAPAAVVAATFGVAGPVEVALHDPLTLLPLVLAAVLQSIIGSALIALWLSGGKRERLRERWFGVIRAKRMMMAGVTLMSLAVAVLVSVDMRWLLVLAPVLWILNRTYEHQLRAGQDRATWAVLAEATRGLNQLDERGVALAVLRGAARMFPAELVEVVLERPRGSRVFRARAGDALSGHVSIVDGAGALLDAHRAVVVRRLTVGAIAVGEVRLYLRRSSTLTESDQHAFSTFAEAAASAFHDASTHRTLRAMTARSAYDALHDSLTGLPNRSTLVARGNAELRRADKERPVALVVVDVDGLREVNEALGYAAGDELLQAVARRLLERLIDGELIGRLGGDEFAILLLDAPSDRSGLCDGYALDRARWLRADLATPTHVGGVLLAVEATMGVVVATAGAADMAELLRRADIALHQAKLEAGRLARYDPSQDPANTDRLALLADLRDALAATDQLTLYVQPTIDLTSGRPIAVEALSRWLHPRRGLLEPADYIPIVDHSDLAGAFTLHVLDLALDLAARLAGQGVRLPVSVNLCARCTSNPDLPMLVADRLTAHGVAPDQLILEITESVAMAEATLAEQVVAGLRELGIAVSVDDFGTGSASLTFLARFPVDEVKIDRTFVANMVDSPETAAIVRATVDLAHDLGMRVVAEGVERAEQRAALMDLGVTAAQGFLFHRPLPLTEATDALLHPPPPPVDRGLAPVS